MNRVRYWLALALVLCVSGLAHAQGDPTGTIEGKVSDPDNLALPGVTVTATSPVLQGARTAVTSAAGDYILPFLPAGEYTVTFELEGFATLKQTISVRMADRQPLNARLELAKLATVVEVTAEASNTATTPTIATTLKASTTDRIPYGRTLDAATLLAAGATNNGPGGNIMISGALSYENLNLVNGVNVNENLRQQARPLYIEDAVQETKVSTGNLSAEYGRFQGGVVNMITKSGGNTFSGSFRTTFNNDGWTALTPYPTDSHVSAISPAYELTFGGPVLRDRIWFFSAGRFENKTQGLTMPYTGYNYTYETNDKRGEGKLTWALNARNTFKLSYLKRNITYVNNSFGTVMDAASLYTNTNKESLIAANYQLVLKNNLFVEAQYSGRRYDNTGTGSQYMDLIGGTPIWDRSRGSARFNTATYCAVCPNAVDRKNNDDYYAKVNYFISTKNAGSHNIVAGYDYFDEMRMNNQNSVASGYRLQVTSAVISGTTIYPVVLSGSSTSTAAYIDWRPVFQDTVGNHLRTYSAFGNDVWRINSHATVNIGVRFDKNSTRDQGGALVGNSNSLSPRLGLTYDFRGDGNWLANVGFGHYVGMFNTQIADAASAAGRESNYSYWYQGPAINTGAGPYKTSAEALQIVWNWFFANGGTNRAVRTSPSVVGVNTSVSPDVKSANSDEYTLGLAHNLNNKGAVRVDFVYRRYYDFYANYLNLNTGRATDPRTGQTFDMTVVNNTNDVMRDYKGLSFQFDARLRKNLQLAGNYLLSFSRGNVEGEDSANGATRSDVVSFPQYRQASWNTPVGYTNGDQRHKIRLWGTYTLPVPDRAGRIDAGFMQRYDSGSPWDYNISIDTRPYVTNPGYLVPPSSVTYFIDGRGVYTFDSAWRTDLSLTWTYKVYRKNEVFLRAVTNNVFNNSAMTSWNTSLVTTGLAAFNPFTTKPVEGVNYAKGPAFGQAVDPGSYQTPRSFYFAIGARF